MSPFLLFGTDVGDELLAQGRCKCYFFFLVKLLLKLMVVLQLLSKLMKDSF